MKTYILSATILLLSLSAFGQVIIPYPIPCVEVTPSNVDSLPSGVQATDCIEADGATVTFNADQNYSIRAGEYIAFNPNTTINPDESHSFHAYIDNGGMDLAWYEPNVSPGTVGLYDKLEIGIQFNDSINQKIERFINRETGEKLNPFDPDDVDLYAEFWVELGGSWYGPKRVNGFYYQEFDYNGTFSAYDTISTEHQFRIRHSPSVTGLWRCQVKAVVAGYDTINAYEFTFDCVPSDNPGFMRVGDNKRYFRRGSESFFPVGHNLFGPAHDSGDVKMSSIAEYLEYFDDMRELKNNGANYFRHIICPWNTDIEFEHLGDYSNRLTNAWNMDNIIDTAKALDLVMHLNMAIHYTFERPTELHRQRYWDWAKPGDSLMTPISPAPLGCFTSNDSGYCYRSDLGLIDPVDFFEDSTAKQYYKNRIRYMVARWSYSTSVGLFEILSEANHTGRLNTVELVVVDSSNVCQHTETYEPYTDSPDRLPELLSHWHKEMAGYMHDDLMINQPVSANYTGNPHIENKDSTFKQDEIDVATYNEYRIEIDKYVDSYVTVEGKYHCEDSVDWYVDKPFMHSEYGMGGAKIYECDSNCTFIRRTLITPLTGMASIAITWDDQKNERDTWKYLGIANDFMSEVPLDEDNYIAQAPIITAEQGIEILYLRNQGGTGYKIFGAVANRTYNFYTQTDDDSSSCAIQHGELPDVSLYRSPHNYHGTDYLDSIRLQNMGWVKKYKIEWFNATTGNFIFSESRWTNTSSELQLEFPVLTGYSEQPIIYFKVFPWGETLAMESATTKDSSSFDNFTTETKKDISGVQITDWSNIELRVKTHPNPVNDLLQVSISGGSKIIGENWFFYNSLGETILEGVVSETNFSIDLSVYENGIYFLRIDGINSVNKIVKNE